MYAPIDNTKIVTPFIPSLFHLSTIPVAFPLFGTCDGKTIKKVLRDIQNGKTKRPSKKHQETLETYNRIKDFFMLIPHHLREPVVKAIYGMEYEDQLWQMEHSDSLENINAEFEIIWRCDGTIDRVKTAEEMVLNENIDVKTRFELACMYSFEDIIKTLWTQMETSGLTANFETDENSLESFWINRLRDGFQIPLAEAILEHTGPLPGSFRRSQILTCSSSLHKVKPEERQQMLLSLEFSFMDDLRFCFYAVSRDEEKYIIKRQLHRVIELYLKWPLQGLFLQTVDRLWNHIGVHSFCAALSLILEMDDKKFDYNYLELLRGLWDQGPKHLRESVEESPFWNEEVRFFISEKGNEQNSEDRGTAKKKLRLDTA